MDIGKSIKFYRKLKNLTSTELGERAGLTQSAISQIENGHRNPTPKTLRSIAHGLGVSAEDILKKAETFKTIPEMDPLEISKKEKMFQRRADITIKISDYLLVGIDIRALDLYSNSIAGKHPGSVLEAIFEKVLVELISNNRDELEQRLLEELQYTETIIEDILRDPNW